MKHSIQRYWKVILALVVIFTAGGGVGFGVGTGAREERQRDLGKPEGWAVNMMRRMEQTLDLTDEQKAALAPALRQTAADLYHIRRKATREQAIAIRDFYAEIEPVLDEEQLSELRKSRQRVRERLEHLQQQIQNGEAAGMRPPLRPLREGEMLERRARALEAAEGRE